MATILDQLLPNTGEISGDDLQRLIDKPIDDRPQEGLFFEFKSQWTPNKIPKSVAAFANASGGFIFIGAEAKNGQLSSLPGVPRDEREWALEISNLVLGNISPHPAWRPHLVTVPGDPKRVVVLIRVEASSNPPHVLVASGAIYLRSPGGSSDPVRDRATLDRIAERGREGQRLADARAAGMVQSLPFPNAGWQFVLVSVPIPYDPSLLNAPVKGIDRHNAIRLCSGQRLRHGSHGRPTDDGVRVDFGDAHVQLFQDLSLRLWWQPTSIKNFVPAYLLHEMAADALRTQLRRSVRDTILLFVLRNASGCVVANSEGSFPSPAAPPDPWYWKLEATLLDPEIERIAHQMEQRLWRSAGMEAFDDD